MGSKSRAKRKPMVFVSYAHADEVWRTRLRPHLELLWQVGMLTVWDDHDINVGSHWHPEILRALNRARFAICLISSDFLASEFVSDEEVPRLLERRARGKLEVIPVLLRSCSWKAVDWLKAIQMLPRNGKSVATHYRDNWDDVFAQVAERIYDVLQGEKRSTRKPSKRKRN